MRGILLIGILLALAIVGYLSLRSTNQLTRPTAGEGQTVTEEVEQELERLTDERMKRLEELDR